MTKEEIKKIMPLMQAMLEGKTIQRYYVLGGEWVDTEHISLEFEDNIRNYRIKPEPKFRPFKTKEECWNEMHNHPDFGWVKRINGGYKQIMSIHIDIFNKHCAGFAGQTGTACFEFEYIYKKYTFTDGTPFGIKEE